WRRCRDRRERHPAVDQRKVTPNELPTARRVHQLAERPRLRIEFNDQFHRTTTRQAKLARLVGVHTISGDLWRALTFKAAIAIDQVVLDAATRDRPDHGSVATHRHQRADGPRR